ncbi:MAG: MFS transporter, partial [Thermodesulfobacteriota bacterium]
MGLRSEISQIGGKVIPKSGTTIFLYIAVSIASLGGLIYGYDLAGIAGAILFIKKEFSLSPFSQELILSSVLFGAMIGAALGGKLTDKLGRRKILIISAVISFVGVLGTVLANGILMLIIARIVVGAAFGILSFAVPLYISE